MAKISWNILFFELKKVIYLIFVTIFARSELSRQQRWSVVLADMAQIRWCLFGLVWNVSWVSPPWVSEFSPNEGRFLERGCPDLHFPTPTPQLPYVCGGVVHRRPLINFCLGCLRPRPNQHSFIGSSSPNLQVGRRLHLMFTVGTRSPCVLRARYDICNPCRRPQPSSHRRFVLPAPQIHFVKTSGRLFTQQTFTPRQK